MHACAVSGLCLLSAEAFLFFFFLHFFIFREAAQKDKVSGQVSSAGQPDASLSQALSPCVLTIPPPPPPVLLYHHYHPTLSSAALSLIPVVGILCPVLSPPMLWDQM